MSYRVSVIIPTYNRSKYLINCLDSVFSQSFKDFEIIVVDDGSTDNTLSILDKYAHKINYIKQKNLGVSSARNCGIKNSKGIWLAFLDSDDLWHKDKLRYQIDYLDKNEGALICHTDEKWYKNGLYINQMDKHKKSGGRLFVKSLQMCMISPSSVMIKKDLFDKIGLFDESLPACEDYDLWLRITSQYDIGFIDKSLVIKNGGHCDQLSKKYWGMDRFRIKAIEKILNMNSLCEEYESLARLMIVKKAKIYMQGLKKRGRKEEFSYYENIIKRY